MPLRYTPAGEDLKKTGFYRMDIKALNARLWVLMAEYGATLSSIGKNSLVISKTGSDKDLAELYALLEGPAFTGLLQERADCRGKPGSV